MNSDEPKPQQDASRNEEALTTTPSNLPGAPKKELTPEEQMALYEENLKETDWGHQPC